MKKIILSLLTVHAIHTYGQVAGYSVNLQTVPDNNLKQIYLINPNFSSSFAALVSTGLTKFSQSKELRLIDSKTLLEKKKIAVPDYNKFDYLDYFGDGSFIATKQNIVIFYKKKNDANSDITDVYAARIDESLTPPQQPAYLFGAEDPQRWNKNYDWKTFYLNDNKDLGLFAYITENKKKNYRNFYYRLYDNNLKLIRSDSVTGGFKTADTCSVQVYDNGAALIKNKGTQIEITIFNARTNKSSKVTLNGKEKTLYLGKIKTLAGGKLILCGNYTTETKGKLNGIFKITFDPVKQAIEGEIYSDHVPFGKLEMKRKIIKNILITESGTCYVAFYQVSREDNEGFTVGSRKYEIMGIGSAGEKWQKQIAVLDQSVHQVNLVLNKENLIVLYPDNEGKKNEKIDYNNYEYGNPYPQLNRGQGRLCNSILKITPNGTVTHQLAEDIYVYMPSILVGSDIVGVEAESTNAENTFKVGFVRFLIK